ncbi:MAG TPA: UbiD family decarboxylase [Chloroflexota bacterium]|nr:UbiD family decarboxylase [Chloroflexota bacterium]
MAAAEIKAATSTQDLHQFLDEYEREHPDEILHIERPIDAKWEVTALINKLEKAKRFPVVVCHNLMVDGERSEMPLVTFLLASRLRLARLLGANVRNVGLMAYEREQARLKPVTVSRSDAPVKEVVETGGALDVCKLPAIVHHRMDPGRYITAGFFLTYNLETGADNSAMHRGWLKDRDEIPILLGPASHNRFNFRQYEQAGKDMPAAFWVGHHPLVEMGAQTRVGPDDSHYETAGGMSGAPLRLVASETLGNNFLVPADAEVVIEGYVPAGQRRPEGPFGEYTRHVGPQVWGPVLKVTAITRRRHAYWDDVMVGHPHWNSLGNEGAIFRAVRQAVPGIKAVHVPMSGAYANIYLQIRKTVEGQGKTAAALALSSFFQYKHVFVFDDDVDIFDEKEVMQAFAWRFQGDRDLLVIQGMSGTGLDPSSPDGTTMTKVGFDCTKPVGKPFAERLAIPDDVMDQIDPSDFVGQERIDRIPLEPWG